MGRIPQLIINQPRWFDTAATADLVIDLLGPKHLSSSTLEREFQGMIGMDGSGGNMGAPEKFRDQKWEAS